MSVSITAYHEYHPKKNSMVVDIIQIQESRETNILITTKFVDQELQFAFNPISDADSKDLN